MRFEDEQYVRLYKRDTTTWLMLNWQGRCILPLIFRKLDRAGLLDLGEDGYEALAAHIQVPVEIVEEGMKSILRRSALVLQPDGLLFAPRFIEAQEAKQSDKARQKASRDRARDLAAAAVKGLLPAGTVTEPGDGDSSPGSTPPPSDTPPRGVTPRDPSVTSRDAAVTPRDETVTRGHATSHGVTLSPAQPSSAQQSLDTPVAPKGGPSSDAPKREKRTRAGTVMTTWPEGFAVSPAIAKMCREEGLPNPYDVIRDFESSARAKAYRYADWEAAFRKWMRSDITRKGYPVWEPEPEAQAAITYGPPVDPTPEQRAILDRILTRPKAATPLLAEAAAADTGAAVFWTPPKARAGGDS